MFRGQPSPDHDQAAYARNQAQKSHWERDPRVTVTMRPLKYAYIRDKDGSLIRGLDGRKVPTGEKRVKGIDVLCALALVRASTDPSIDLVILASSDSDLEPALDEALASRGHGTQLPTGSTPGRAARSPLRPRAVAGQFAGVVAVNAVYAGVIVGLVILWSRRGPIWAGYAWACGNLGRRPAGGGGEAEAHGSRLKPFTVDVRVPYPDRAFLPILEKR